MAGEMQVVVIGNLAGDPELRFTSGGHAVANFTIAQTPRTFNRDTNQWVDDETLWVRASVWREAAENVAESLTKGMRVIAYGKLKARSFETKDGQQRTNWELEVEEIAPSLKWATAQVNRSQPGQSPGQSSGQSYGQNQWSQSPQHNNHAAPSDVWGGQPQGQGDAPF